MSEQIEYGRPWWEVMDEIQAENARLKAEVEQSKRINTELLVLSERQASDIRRLTKAGDAMAKVITEYRCSPWGNKVKDSFEVWTAWNAAKQGGQP